MQIMRTVSGSAAAASDMEGDEPAAALTLRTRTYQSVISTIPASNPKSHFLPRPSEGLLLRCWSCKPEPPEEPFAPRVSASFDIVASVVMNIDCFLKWMRPKSVMVVRSRFPFFKPAPKPSKEDCRRVFTYHKT
jgi:hypothetical protein